MRYAIFILALAVVIGGVALLNKAPINKDSVAQSVESVVKIAPAPAPTTVVVLPAEIVQGDPVEVVIATTTAPESVVLGSAELKALSYNDKYIAFSPIDLNAKAGSRTLYIKFPDGESITRRVAVGMRKPIEAPLGIPDALGGNSTSSEAALVSTLASENATLASIPTASTRLWTQAFAYPVDHPIVTDIYGYTRATGAYTIAHKGTDFRAAVGTPVKAINSGVVRLVEDFRDYGKTIIVDHGLGVESFYMHLSSQGVKVGDTVTRGEVIGLSGDTGYASGPHLHLTIRINGVSIDPAVFLSFFVK